MTPFASWVIQFYDALNFHSNENSYHWVFSYALTLSNAQRDVILKPMEFSQSSFDMALNFLNSNSHVANQNHILLFRNPLRISI